jgi:L-ascorbate metabolism protein UlaG (beta-lactamase superfamily)
MEIKSLGHSSFRIKGKKAILVTDPYGSSIGFKMPSVSADIVTVSHDHHDHNYIQAVGKTARREPFVISGPGEYEILGVSVFGIPSFHDNSQGEKRGKNTICVIDIEGMRLVHLGDLGHRLNDKQLEEVNGVDILFIPVGGTFTLGPRRAVEVVAQLDPKVVIPMHYQVPGLTLNLAPVDEFLKELGVETKPVSKLVISRDKLPEEREVVIFKKI